MLILLPPSEGKTEPRRGKPLDLDRLGSSELGAARARVLESLVTHCRNEPEHAATTLGLGPTQRDLVTRNAALCTAATARADRVYTGVLYDALGFASLSTSGKRRANGRLAIMSSLFGLVRPNDPIPAYRLSGDATLPGIGPIAGFWREHLEEPLLDALGAGLLVDLRSGMYAAFWRPGSDLAARVATVRVLHEHNGTRKVVSHFNKATKGRIVRAVLEAGSKPRTPAQFADLLRDLGWTVEASPLRATGTQLDVVVEEI